MNSKSFRFLSPLLLVLGLGSNSLLAWGGNNLPPFDFSDAFYLANGIDPTTLIGRPAGNPPNSVIDNTPNGPDFNNVRLLAHTAAFDHSGHPIFFNVTGLPTLASFTNNVAGQHARQIADQYKVYEFPHAANPTFSVFPKRQDLIADLRNGYFSNDPLGIWQINLVRYTPAAFNTQAGQQALAELAADNGLDLDGTPLVRTLSELEDLEDDGFVSIVTPPAGGPDFRWFFCPVMEDPRDGAVMPDAHLEIIELANGDPLPAEQESFDLFNCLQSTGEPCDFQGIGKPYCGALANSTGAPGLLSASGSASVAADNLTLRAAQLPVNRPTLFIAGANAQNVPFGDGRLCLTAPVLRLNPGSNSSSNGIATKSIDFHAHPASGAFLPGTTWHFQAWYRDPVGGPAGFNLTHGLRVTFQ
ncbi:MAG TPA: hypothetical protein VK843_20140 [Planctomycetota bacterium]|nr:hypothetical protein [Planctomycetota bacterium]